jgi:mono/diheme cytochrome c family protein
MRRIAPAVLGTIALAITACGPSTTSTASRAPTSTGTSAGGEAAPTTFAAQVAQGQSLYGEHCASCHGDSGQGTSHGPRVVGIAQGALPLAPPSGSPRTTQFVTVADVGTYAATRMPADHPGSLAAAQYWAILAFDLHANGIDLQQPLTPELAATLTIPR